jgi:hypothetical protein
VAGNASFLKAETTQAWLSQFNPEDQEMAADLLRSMMLVSRDKFAERLLEVLERCLADGNTPIGLYVERELRHRKGVPHRLFKESKGKIKRAYGSGPDPVKPIKPWNPDVGSEGLVAQIVSEFCRRHSKKTFNHPGPDQIRKHKIRRFVLVTDYIGSGKRAWTYLEAAWRVRSVRSWWSTKEAKGMRFEVVAYAASPDGRSRVEGHPSQPKIRVAISCPTIRNSFGSAKRSTVLDLCHRYSPDKDADPLGFGSVGALIAFAHGVPNNAPLILYKRGANWTPLFPARLTSGSRSDFGTDEDTSDAIRAKLAAMRQKRLAESGWIETGKKHARTTLMVMAALSQRPRHAEAISGRTGLTIIEVEQALRRALAYKWIDGRNRLTDEGHEQLAHLRKQGLKISSLPVEEEEFYYPKALRAPAGMSS